MQNVEHQDIELVELGFIGTRRQSEDKLKECKFVELDDQGGLRGW